jgi:hypothetical protein
LFILTKKEVDPMTCGAKHKAAPAKKTAAKKTAAKSKTKKK